ncbi:RagB/SusD family nutrient uptake outer membrane protein [Seonamhaeicola sp.]|uniref:RagB/SusD family nutrient uptake outer membrane protein n=1 Tax=Seonamhaeicola sp. TaxID=1912245 RepID=UPI00262935FC|nr:RagB/SusD family nutrient uptake outer membrane protein [Seonamhaeicola sp.]
MKNKIKSIYILALTTVFFGCFELDQIDPINVSEATFWQTVDDLNKGVIATYDALQSRDMYGQNLHILYSGLSDEGTNEHPFEFNALVRFTLSDTNAFGGPHWASNYTLISRAYQVLQNEPNFNKPEVAGQAEFMIALGYFNLVNFFGENVAYVDKVQVPADRPFSAENGQIYTLMESMLISAIDKLPLSWPVNEYGKVTKGAAQALLAKHYFQLGRYADAEILLKAIIDSGQYSLLPNFADNFRETGEVNPEAIFVVNFIENGPTNETDNNRRHQIFSVSEQGGAFGDIQCTNMIFNAFVREETASGSKDSRMDQTIIYPGSELTYYGLTGDVWAEAAPNPELLTGFYKYSEQEHVENNGNGTALEEDGGTDYIVLRYADILLMYAEALNAGGNTAQAVTYVDQVRARSGRPALLTAYPGAAGSQTAFRDQLEQERILELSGENWRYFDLRRWGKYNNAQQVEDANFATFTDGQDEVAGIPQLELDTNANLKPNQAN